MHGQCPMQNIESREVRLQSSMTVILRVRSDIIHRVGEFGDLQPHTLVPAEPANGFSNLDFVELTICVLFQGLRQIGSFSIMTFATSAVPTPVISPSAATTCTEVITISRKRYRPHVFPLPFTFAQDTYFGLQCVELSRCSCLCPFKESLVVKKFFRVY